MNILIITQHIGKTAPGIVFERLISSLSQLAYVSVITFNYNKSEHTDFSKIQKIVKIKEPVFINKRWNYHINTIFLKLFGISFTDYKAKNKKIILDDKYDFILSLCSMHNTAPLALGEKLRNIYSLPLGVYFVDAIPTPIWWTDGKRDIYLEKFLKRYTRNVVYVASSNERMLDYQVKFVSSRTYLKSVIYTPSSINKVHNKKPINKTRPIFLYTGSIYGIRTAKYVLEAFQILLTSIPEAEFHFVGTKPFQINYLNSATKSRIKFFPFSQDLTEFYENSDVLIDIDANYERDIFLSSKIATYLSLSKPIICVTGKYSPSSQLLKGIEGVSLCAHNIQEILYAMKTSLLNINDYSKRRDIQKKFDTNMVVSKLFDDLTSIIVL